MTALAFTGREIFRASSVKLFSPLSQYSDDVRLENPSSVNPDLRLNRIKSSVKSNPDYRDLLY